MLFSIATLSIMKAATLGVAPLIRPLM